VTTPPNPPEGNDNIYGSQPPPPPPDQNNPYGATPYPGGGAPYGAPAPAGKTDGVSIAAFVSGLVCCAPVGIVLGIIGIRRTKDGQRKGRWAAVIGLVLGALGVLAWIGVVAGGLWIFNNAITPGNAEVGQCVNIDTDDNEVTMLKKDCDESHDGEIVAVEKVDSDNKDAVTAAMADYCQQVLSDDDLATIQGDSNLTLSAVIEDPKKVDNGDHLVCYVEGDKKLTEKVLK
jgi:hypothetical protein